MKATKYAQGNRPMQVSTPLPFDTLLLVGFRGSEHVSQPFQFQADLLAENGQRIPFDRLLGQRMTISVALGGGRVRHLSGLVSRFSQGARDNSFTAHRAEIVPQFWLLPRRAQSRIFQHKTVPEILKEVLRGLDVTYQIQGKFEPRDYCVQYRETDFAFASRLMEEEGIFYFFKHAEDGHVMVVANTPPSHPDLPGPGTLVYDEVEGGNRPDFRITAWEKVQELRAGKVTLWDHCFELPHQHLEADRPILESVPVGQVTHKLRPGVSSRLEIYDYPGGYAQRFDGIDKGG